MLRLTPKPQWEWRSSTSQWQRSEPPVPAPKLSASAPVTPRGGLAPLRVGGRPAPVQIHSPPLQSHRLSALADLDSRMMSITLPGTPRVPGSTRQTRHAGSHGLNYVSSEAIAELDALLEDGLSPPVTSGPRWAQKDWSGPAGGGLMGGSRPRTTTWSSTDHSARSNDEMYRRLKSHRNAHRRWRRLANGLSSNALCRAFGARDRASGGQARSDDLDDLKSAFAKSLAPKLKPKRFGELVQGVEEASRLEP